MTERSKSHVSAMEMYPPVFCGLGATQLIIPFEFDGRSPIWGRTRTQPIQVYGQSFPPHLMISATLDV